MSNYKKISIVSEYNKKTKKWDIKTIVIFRNNDSPIVEDYDRNKHLNLIREFIELIGHDILHEGLKSAKDNGKITIISKSDKKNVEILNKEVLEEQIKYSNSRNKKVDQTLGMNVEKQKIEIEKLLNDCRKINIVYENDEINNRKIPKQIVIFRNNGEPIIEKYNDAKHSKFCQLFAEKCGFDLSNNGVEEAIRANFIATTLNYRKESLDALNAEILDDQLKFSKVQNATLENKNDNMTVGKVEQILPGKSEHDLDEYFALDEKRNNGKISSDEKKRLEELSSNNRKIAFLENAKVLYNAGEISEDAYLTIKDSYKNKLNRKNQEQKKGKSIFSRLKLNRKGIGNTAMKINDNSTDRIVPIPVGKEKLSVKLKRHWKKITAGILAATAIITGVNLISNSKKPAINRVQINTENSTLGATTGAAIGINNINNKVSVGVSALDGSMLNLNYSGTENAFYNHEDKLDLLSSLNYYFETMDVPENTQKFIMQENVQQFLSQYTNISQLREVLSALCYGYEANMLSLASENFRIEEDGQNYLRTFTSDFLCAKVVVNNYTPEQMLAVFGNDNINYEQVMDGFKSYCNTVSIYGTTATSVLPFKYLTNGDNATTNALEVLFEKLATVNENRKNGTLTSEHTDDFIVAVDNFFVHNDQKLRLTEGIKTVAAAIVDSYIYMQANLANSDEALYLHEDHGLSKAGINLLNPDTKDLDGTVIDKAKDSLLNSIYLLYADDDLVNKNCLTQKQILLANINEMNSISNSTMQDAVSNFANLLYQNGLYYYGNEVSKGNYSQTILDKIEKENPSLAMDIARFEQKINNTSDDSYIPFYITTNGIDELLGIRGLSNDLTLLINIRRELSKKYDNFEIISGTRYSYANLYPSFDNSGFEIPSPTTITSTTREFVDYDDLDLSEKESVDEQKQKIIDSENKSNSEQEELAKQQAQEIINQVQSGTITTQEEAQKKADEVGMSLESDIVKQIIEIHDNPELSAEVDREIADKNKEAESNAASQKNEEEEKQRKELYEIQQLISQGNSSSNIDYSSDPNVGNPAVDEQPQTEALPETSSADSTGLVQDTSNQVVEETTFEAPSIDYSSDPNVGNPAVDEQPQTNALPETSSAEATSLTQDTSNQVVEETTFEAPSIDYSSDPNVGNPAVDEQPQTNALPETSSAEATSLTQDTSNQVVEETTFEAPSIDYSSDPNVGNPAVDEQPYTESLPSAKEELQLMRNALADVNPEVLGLTGEVDLGYAKKLNL